MKNWAIFTLASLLSLSVGGTGAYLVHGVTDSNNTTSQPPVNSGNSTPDTEEEVVVPEESVDNTPSFSKLVTNMVSTQEIISPKFSITLARAGQNDIKLDLNNLDMDISDVLSTKNIADLKLKANLNVRYQNVDENVGFIMEEGTAYLTYKNKNYAFNAPKTIEGILPLLNNLGIEVPTFSGSNEGIFSNVNMEALMNKVMDLGNNAVQIPTSYGYDYKINLSGILSEFKLPITLENPKIILCSDYDNNLIGIKTDSDGFKINSDYNISFDSFGLNLNTSSLYEKLTEAQKKLYEDLTDVVSNLATTFAELMQKMSFQASYAIHLRDETNNVMAQDFIGDLQADLSKIQADLTHGAYELNMTHKVNDKVANQICSLYRDNNIYLQLNNLLKGKMSDQTVNDLFERISQELEALGYDINLETITQMINSVIQKLDIDNFIKGSFGKIKDYILSFDFLSDGVQAVVSGDAFGLGEVDLTLKIMDISTSIRNGFRLEISNFRYKNYVFGFETNIRPQKDITLLKTEEELSQFKDYKGIIPIFDTVSDLINERKFNSKYSINVTDQSGQLIQGSGTLSADVSSLDLTSANRNYGTYELTFDTALSGVEHNLTANYQDNTLFFSVDDFMNQKISNQGMAAVYDVLNGIFNDKSVQPAVDGVDNVLDHIASINFVDKLLGEIKGDYSLTHVEEVLSVDKDNTDPTKLVLDLNLDYILDGTTLANQIKGVSLEINTDDDRMTGISIFGLGYQGFTVDFSLSLEEEFTDFRLPADVYDNYYEMSNVSQIIKGFYDLPTDFKTFGLELEGAVYKQDALTQSENELMALVGDCQVDNTIPQAPNLGGTLHLYQPYSDATSQGSPATDGTQTPDETITDEGTTEGEETKPGKYDNYTDHRILFEYSGDRNNGQTIAEYTTIDKNIENPGTMHLLLQNKDIFSIYDRVKGVGNNPNNLLFKYLKNYFNTARAVSTGLPVVDSFVNKDFSAFNNENIKEVRITDRKVYIELSSRMFDDSDTSGKSEIITFEFDDNNKLSKVTVDGYYSSYHIQASIGLSAYDPEKLPTLMEYNDQTKANFVDAHGFDLLAQCLITTTEHRFFDLSGMLNLNMEIFGFDLTGLKTYFTCYVYVQEQSTTAYLAFNNKGANATYLKNKDFCGVEFFVVEDMAYSIRTQTVLKSSGSLWNKKEWYESTTEVRKFSRDELLNNIIYYIFSYVMNIEKMKIDLLLYEVPVGNIILGNIYGALNASDTTTMSTEGTASESTATISRNFSSVLQSATYDEDKRTMTMTACLGKLITMKDNLVEFDVDGKPGLNASITYDENHELTNLSLNLDLKAVSLITVNLTFNLNRNAGAVDADDQNRNAKMTRFDTILDMFQNDERVQNLENYVISSITAKPDSAYTYNGVTIVDNYSEAVLKFTVSMEKSDSKNNSNDRLYFYQEL